MRWTSTPSPTPLYASTTSGSMPNRSNGHLPDCPSMINCTSRVVGTVPAGNTNSVRAVVGDMCRLMGAASVSPRGVRKFVPGTMPTSASSRSAVGCIAFGVTMTTTSSSATDSVESPPRSWSVSPYTSRDPAYSVTITAATSDQNRRGRVRANDTADTTGKIPAAGAPGPLSSERVGH